MVCHQWGFFAAPEAPWAYSLGGWAWGAIVGNKSSYGYILVCSKPIVFHIVLHAIKIKAKQGPVSIMRTSKRIDNSPNASHASTCCGIGSSLTAPSPTPNPPPRIVACSCCSSPPTPTPAASSAAPVTASAVKASAVKYSAVNGLTLRFMNGCVPRASESDTRDTISNAQRS